MSFVLVLIAPDNGPEMTDRLLEDVAKPIPEGLRSAFARWLAPGKACELQISPGPIDGTTAPWSNADDMVEFIRTDVIAAIAHPHGTDAAILPSQNRRKTLLVADMESTIIEQEMLDELADVINARQHISEITARAMRGELDFEAALNERVALFKGLPRATLAEFAGRMTLMPGAATLLATMRANGAYCALVSGGFTIFTEIIKDLICFDEHQANILEFEDDRLTGTVLKPILGRAAKRAALERLARQRDIPLRQSIAVGDGANDLDMLQTAGLGVAYRAKPIVAEAAHSAIRFGDLSALLYLQGYTQDQFVTK